MPELAWLRICALVRFVDRTRRAIVYATFTDELGESRIVEFPGGDAGHQLGALPGQSPRQPP